MTEITFDDIEQIKQTDELNDAGGVFLGFIKLQGYNLGEYVNDNIRSIVLASNWMYEYCVENEPDNMNMELIKEQLSKF